MAVFTEVSPEAAGALLQELNLGQLAELRGIQGGIENTNYFVTTEQDGEQQRWVLTLFERLGAEQLPFYLYLMKHLAGRGIPVPDPAANRDGDILHTVSDKPAAVVNKLAGKSQLQPQAAHSAAVGEMLARMHLAGADYDRSQPNLRGLAWWNETVPVVLPHLDDAQAALLRNELAYQNHIASSAAYAALPRGPVHADLFRDNVMFAEPQGPADPHPARLTGFFDFYFAGVDTWLFDLAVCLNDWCIVHSSGADDGSDQPGLVEAFVGAYQSVRPLTAPATAPSLVIDLLRVRDNQQVTLEVRIAEISRSVLDKLGMGVQASANGGRWTASSSFLGGGGASASLLFGGINGLSLEAEARNGLVRILAEPTIVAMSGQEGSFLVGGKVFIPIIQPGAATGNTITSLNDWTLVDVGILV